MGGGDEAGLAETLDDWLAGAPFEAALGLAPGWRDVVRQGAQLRALGELVRDLSPRSTRATAQTLAARLRAYEAAGWRSDRSTGRRPPGGGGLLYDFLRAGGPTSAERLRKMLFGLPKRLS